MANLTVPSFVNYIPTIHPCGDSILQGVGSTLQSGWRQTWYNLNRTAGGLRRFRFVGSQVTTLNGLTVNPNHEGITGTVVHPGNASSIINAPGGFGIQPQTPIFTPDIILLQAGTNDLDPGVLNDSPATLAASWSTELDIAFGLIRCKSWAVIIFLPLLVRTDATNTKILAANALIAATVAAKSYAARIFVPLTYSASIPNPTVGVNMNDVVHPNDAGYIPAGTALATDPATIAAIQAARPS